MTSISNLTQSYENDTKTRCTKQWMQSMIQAWQTRLFLKHWTIEAHPSRILPEDVYFQVETIRDRSHAFIYYHPDRNINTEKLSIAFVHEMVHIVLDPLREEHDFQMSYGIDSQKDEYKKRFTRELEKSVETIARTLYYSF